MNKKFIEECEEAYWKALDRFGHKWEKYIPYCEKTEHYKNENRR